MSFLIVVVNKEPELDKVYYKKLTFNILHSSRLT